jgi:hypothetical protein
MKLQITIAIVSALAMMIPSAFGTYYGDPNFSKPTHLIDNCTMPDPKTQCFSKVLENGTLYFGNGKPSLVDVTEAPDAGIQRNFQEPGYEVGDEEVVDEEVVDEVPSEDEEVETDEVPRSGSGVQSDQMGGQSEEISPTFDWMNACSTIQQFLYQSCDAYVNSDGTLTSAGERAVVCIRNGAVLAAGGTVGGVPPSIAADILGGLAEMTGCGGIVDMQEVRQVVSLGGLTDISSLSKFLP